MEGSKRQPASAPASGRAFGKGPRKESPDRGGRRSPPGTNGAADRAPQGSNGAAKRSPPGTGRAPTHAKGVPRRSNIGAPRSPPVGTEKVYKANQAAKLGPEEQRVFKWAPRCRVCGNPIRGTVEVIATNDGPDRGNFAMACHHIICPTCRNENFISPMTAWLVVAGPLPVQQ